MSDLKKSFLETIAEVSSNLAAVWCAVILISPGIGNLTTSEEMLKLLWANLPPAITFAVAAVKIREGVAKNDT